jgi:glycosyltransferase involved in cell wall biosynthesis
MTKASRPRGKRIVMWLPGLSEYGGIAAHNRTFCKAVSQYAREHDVTVDVVSLRDPRGYFDPDFLTHPLIGCEGKSISFGLSALRSLLRGFDLLVVGVVDFGVLVPAARLRNPRARILTITYGVEVWKPLSRAMRLALSQANSVSTISDYTAEQVARLHGVERDRIHVLPPPLDPHFLEMATQTSPAADEPVRSRMLSISRLNEIDAPKGVERVIEALPALRVRVPDVNYVVIGTGDDRARIERLAAQHGVDDITRFLGAVDDRELHRYLDGTDLFVLPSAKEGFGIVFLEAAVYEKAVIAGNHGGSPEVVIDQLTGVLVDASDVQGLSDAAAELLLDDSRRAELGRNGAERVRSEYTYESFAQRTSLALDSLLYPGAATPTPVAAATLP